MKQNTKRRTMSKDTVCLSVLISTELYDKLTELLMTEKDKGMSDLLRQILSDRIVDAEISGVIE
jgi:hypothetical protein